MPSPRTQASSLNFRFSAGVIEFQLLGFSTILGSSFVLLLRFIGIGIFGIAIAIGRFSIKPISDYDSDPDTDSDSEGTLFSEIPICLIQLLQCIRIRADRNRLRSAKPRYANACALQRVVCDLPPAAGDFNLPSLPG